MTSSLPSIERLNGGHVGFEFSPVSRMLLSQVNGVGETLSVARAQVGLEHFQASNTAFSASGYVERVEAAGCGALRMDATAIVS